jgi:alpha-tubulin suppressor-like RCC1 family protein
VTTNTGVLENKVVTRVSAGNVFACAIASGKAYCWGQQSNGKLGNGTSTGTASAPVEVTASGVLSGKTLTDISTGGNFACALDTAGAAYCWGGGNSNSGQLGNGDTTQATTPVSVTMPIGKTFTSISAGFNHACALTSDSLLYCWGGNDNGQLGTGDTTSVSVPTPVSAAGALLGTTPSAVSAGALYTCAVASGQAYCWGLQTNGKLGNQETDVFNVTTPAAVYTGGVLSGKTLTKISASGTSSASGAADQGMTCALASGAELYCWGYGVAGRLGNGASVTSAEPVAVAQDSGLAGKTVSTLSVGWSHSCVTTTEAQAFCWGVNSVGQLGDGTTSSSNKPKAINPGALTLGAPPVARPVTTISAGNTFTVGAFGWTAKPGMPGTPSIAGASPNQTLQWTAPAYTGTSELTTYMIYYKPSNKANYGLFATLPTSATSIDLNTYASAGCPAGGTCRRAYGGLTNQSYDWRVLATNSSGSGRMSLTYTALWTP